MAGYLADARVRIPEHYVSAGLRMHGLSRYIEIVRWIVQGGVVERGVINASEISLNIERVPRQLAWSLFLTGLEHTQGKNMAQAIDVVKRASNLSSDWEPAYKADLYFASAEDALYYRLRFC